MYQFIFINALRLVFQFIISYYMTSRNLGQQNHYIFLIVKPWFLSTCLSSTQHTFRFSQDSRLLLATLSSLRLYIIIYLSKNDGYSHSLFFNLNSIDVNQFKLLYQLNPCGLVMTMCHSNLNINLENFNNSKFSKKAHPKFKS